MSFTSVSVLCSQQGHITPRLGKALLLLEPQTAGATGLTGLSGRCWSQPTQEPAANVGNRLQAPQAV